MGDYTPIQVYVFGCPEDQRRAAGEILAEVSRCSESDQNETRYAVVDTTRNTDGEPIRRGQDALAVATFETEAEAREDAEARESAELVPDGDRYDVEPVEWVNVGGEYMVPEMSCGTGSELGDALDDIPGISFVLWEDPYGTYLGDVWAKTPELGLFTAECDANGTVTLEPEHIRDAVEAAETHIARNIAELGGLPRAEFDAAAAAVAVATVLAEIDRATGKPWMDAWHAARRDGASSPDNAHELSAGAPC